MFNWNSMTSLTHVSTTSICILLVVLNKYIFLVYPYFELKSAFWTVNKLKSQLSSYKGDDRISGFPANLGATDVSAILQKMRHEVYPRFTNKVPKSGEYVTEMNHVLRQSCIRSIDVYIGFCYFYYHSHKLWKMAKRKWTLIGLQRQSLTTQ